MYFESPTSIFVPIKSSNLSITGWQELLWGECGARRDCFLARLTPYSCHTSYSTNACGSRLCHQMPDVCGEHWVTRGWRQHAMTPYYMTHRPWLTGLPFYLGGTVPGPPRPSTTGRRVPWELGLASYMASCMSQHSVPRSPSVFRPWSLIKWDRWVIQCEMAQPAQVSTSKCSKAGSLTGLDVPWKEPVLNHQKVNAGYSSTRSYTH